MIRQSTLAAVLADQPLTYAQLAERSGITQRSIEAYATGERNIRMSDFVRLCRAADLDAAWTIVKMIDLTDDPDAIEKPDLPLEDFMGVIDAIDAPVFAAVRRYELGTE